MDNTCRRASLKGCIEGGNDTHSYSLIPRPSTPRPFGKLEREKGAWCEGLGMRLTHSYTLPVKLHSRKSLE